MRVVERTEYEEHFSEGEPELEPPEELAVGELDDDMLLEEDLDSEIVAEEDVDEDTLEATLDDLVHLNDDDDDAAAELGPGGRRVAVLEDGADTDDGDETDAEPLDLADVQESLDRILRERMADTADAAVDEWEDDGSAAGPAGTTTVVTLVTVAPCGDDEFVCRSCFLVRSRVQLADPAGMRCRDCAS